VIAPRSRTDFTGVWKANLEKSLLRGPARKEILVKIEHQGPLLIQQILLVEADGTERRQTFTIEIGGQTINSIGGTPARSRAQWEGRELLVESWMKTPEREFHFKDYWSLSRDGQRLIMAHRDDDLAGQITLLERLSPAETARFD
jgi:hypothetical protein